MDIEDFSSLFRQHLPKISKYFAYRADSDDIEDLAAKVFEIAWRKRKNCPLGYELAWLYRIAGFVLSNHRRKATAISVSLFDSDATAPSAESLVLADIAIALAWNQLSAKDRAVLALVAFDNLHVGEIAVALKISKNAASIRLHRARSAFDKALKEIDKE